MSYINLTGEDLFIKLQDGEIIDIPSAGKAYLSLMFTEEVPYNNKTIEIHYPAFDPHIENLPEKDGQTCYIVPIEVLIAADREDLYSPGPQVGTSLLTYRKIYRGLLAI